MKDALKRAAAALGLASATDVVEMTAEEVEAANKGEGVEGKALSYHQLVHAMDELQAKFDTQGVELANASEQLSATLVLVADKEAALESALSELTALKEQIAKAAEDALAAKLEARKQAIVAALGTDRADAVFEATKDMGEAQFSAVIGAFAASETNEANSAAFKEVGIDAQANVTALVAEAEETATGRILREKYQKTASK